MHDSLEDQVLSGLNRLYADVAEALRVTEQGIWHATPLSVLAAAMDLIAREGLLALESVVFDAGAGDGRVLAALALAFPAHRLHLMGVECDDALAQDARARLSGLPNPPVVATSDYFAEGAQQLRRSDVTFNYPDGSEHALMDAFVAHGKAGARLMVLSPELAPKLGRMPSAVHTIRPGGVVLHWSLSIYHRP